MKNKQEKASTRAKLESKFRTLAQTGAIFLALNTTGLDGQSINKQPDQDKNLAKTEQSSDSQIDKRSNKDYVVSQDKVLEKNDTIIEDQDILIAKEGLKIDLRKKLCKEKGYIYMSEFVDGYAMCRFDFNKLYYCDINGNIAYGPVKEGKSFSDGYVAIKENNVWFIYDKFFKKINGPFDDSNIGNNFKNIGNNYRKYFPNVVGNNKDGYYLEYKNGQKLGPYKSIARFSTGGFSFAEKNGKNLYLTIDGQEMFMYGDISEEQKKEKIKINKQNSLINILKKDINHNYSKEFKLDNIDSIDDNLYLIKSNNLDYLVIYNLNYGLDIKGYISTITTHPKLTNRLINKGLIIKSNQDYKISGKDKNHKILNLLKIKKEEISDITINVIKKEDIKKYYNNIEKGEEKIYEIIDYFFKKLTIEEAFKINDIIDLRHGDISIEDLLSEIKKITGETIDDPKLGE